MVHEIEPDLSATLASRLGDWVAALRFDELPSRVVEVVKLVIIDQLGVQMRGATLSNVQPQYRLVAAMHAAEESTICAKGKRTAAAYAAYVNGTFASSCEFDDCHSFAWHVGSYIVPTALAFGESTRALGRDVITSIVAGVQVMALLGCVTRDNMIRDGWHGAKVLGTFGAAATAGKLLDLSSAQLANAFGIAGSDAAGTMEYDTSGGEVKRMHAGSAGRNGSQAALLAKDGLTGPLTIFEGKRGLFQLFGKTEDILAINELWDHLHVLDTIFRLYPVIGSACPTLDAIHHLRKQHDFCWQEIKAIRVGLMPFAVGHGASITRPTDAVSATFSTAFSMALLLIYGSNHPQDYMNPARWVDPAIISVIDRITPYSAVFPDDAPLLSCRLDIQFNDGRVLSHFQRGFRGHPNCPDTRDEDVTGKFLDNTNGIISIDIGRKIIATVKDLDMLDDLGPLVELLAVSRS